MVLPVLRLHCRHRHGELYHECEVFNILPPRMWSSGQERGHGWSSSCHREVCLLGVSLLHADRFCRLKFTDAFTFGAECLISHYVAMWVMAYADQVIMSGQPSVASIGNLLYSSGVGKHTSIVYLNKVDDRPLAVSQFIWEHNSQRPNGYSFPVACPLCRSIYSWSKPPSSLAESGSAHVLRCKAVVGDRKCQGTWTIPARPSSSLVGAPYVGVWRVV